MPAHRRPSSRPSLRRGVPLVLAAAALVVGAGSGVASADQPAAVDLPAVPGLPPLPEIPNLPEIPGLPPVASLPFAPPPVYEDNLDGWIHEALDIMHTRGIPGSYDGIYRNVMRESGGNPAAINLTDSNAAAGIPSKGLLQVIDPTFERYHVDGTPFDIWDPVANITAACNYAADRYGSMDNVNSAY